MKHKIFILYLILFFYSSNAYAYLDPGLGSLIIQSIVGGIAVGLGAISIFWHKVKTFFSKIFKNSKDKKK